MNRIILFWLLCFCAAPASGVFAQEPPSAVSPATLEKLLEASFERNLGAWLAARYPAQSFLVTGKVELATRTAADPVALPPIFAPAPGTPGLYQTLPDYWQQSSLKINRLTVHLLVNHICDAGCLAELHRLIIPVAGFDLTRGDLLEIEQIDPAIPKPVATNWPARASGDISFPGLKSALPVLTGILILLFLGVFFFSSKIKRAAEASISRVNLDENRKPTGSVGNFISDILPHIGKNLELAAKVLDVWITQSPDSGAQNGACFFRSLPVSYQKQIRNYLSHEKFRRLEQAGTIKNFPIDIDQVQHDFFWDFRRFTHLATNPVHCEDLGAWLQRQSILQVESLLQKLTREMKAIVLAQLPPGRAVLHLKIIPEKNQQKLVCVLARLSEIPETVFQQLEQIISGETKMLINVRPVLFDSVAVLREIWEKADSGLRDDLQHALRDSDVTFSIHRPPEPMVIAAENSTADSIAMIQTVPGPGVVSSDETEFIKKRIRSPERRLERFRRIK